MVRPTPRPPAEILGGADVVVVGLFSAKEKQHRELMADLAGQVTAHGANVVGVFVQRRGVSDGGVSRMDAPFSRRTLIRAGKVREVADSCRRHSAGAVVFFNALTGHQRQVLEDTFSCPVLTAEEVNRATS